MRAGVLTEVVTIERPTISRSGYGGNELAWAVVTTTRARVEFANGDRAAENGEMVWAHACIFTLRIYHEVRDTDRIAWRGRHYRVRFIEPQPHEQRQRVITELINE